MLPSKLWLSCLLVGPLFLLYVPQSNLADAHSCNDLDTCIEDYEFLDDFQFVYAICSGYETSSPAWHGCIADNSGFFAIEQAWFAYGLIEEAAYYMMNLCIVQQICSPFQYCEVNPTLCDWANQMGDLLHHFYFSREMTNTCAAHAAEISHAFSEHCTPNEPPPWEELDEAVQEWMAFAFPQE